MPELAKTLIFFGIIMVLAGLLILGLGKITPMGRLPGDIFIKKENFSFYFPLATCVLISVVLSLIMFFISKK